MVVSNLAHAMAGPQGPGDNGGDHTRCPAVFLNGVHPKRTDGADIRAGVTIDQIAAAKIGQDTLLPSLELAIEDYSGLVGSCDVGFSCTYMNTISWRTPTTPMPMEINPRVVFDRMFGDGATAEERLRRIEPSAAFSMRSPARSGVCRAAWAPTIGIAWPNISIPFAKSNAASSSPKSRRSRISTCPASPRGIPDDFVEHTKLMFDLMAIAFQADITRISTFMMAREVSYRTFPMLGISEAFHPASHHQNNPERLEELTKIKTYHVGLWSYLLEKLKATPDGDGNLLDHSLLLYGGAMSNSNVHNHSPLPILVAGGAHGTMKGGRHLKYPENTPMANLLLTILDKAGIPQESVGDSTGLLSEV